MVAIPEDFWRDEEDALVDILTRHLYAAASTAGQGALAGLGDAVSVDWALVNEQVREWSRSMSLDLVKGITETSRKFTTDAIGAWIESGEPLPELAAKLEPMFGPVRAEMVASTEVSNAFAEGNVAAWRLSGVVDGYRFNTAVDERVCPQCGPLHGEEFPLSDTEHRPALHVRCRCWVTPALKL